MSNKFYPKNKIIRLCMIEMSMEEQGNLEEANLLFLKEYN